MSGAFSAKYFLQALAFERQRVFVNAAQPRVNIRDDILCADHPDHLLRALRVRGKLAAAERGEQQVALLSDRLRTAQDVSGRRSELAHLASMRSAIQARDFLAYRVVTS